METKRNINHISQVMGVPEQNMQQFISDSPWSGLKLISVLQQEIAFHPHFQEGSVLLIDESADEKAGEYSAGAGRQYNGRLGKIEMSQVGVFLSLVNRGYHNWIDGELFFPEKWFSDEYSRKRQRIGMPEQRTFATKLELALQMTQRVYENGVPFCAVDRDSLYGRSGEFRDQLDQQGIEYYGDIPNDTRLYRQRPQVIYPLTPKRDSFQEP